MHETPHFTSCPRLLGTAVLMAESRGLIPWQMSNPCGATDDMLLFKYLHERGKCLHERGDEGLITK